MSKEPQIKPVKERDNLDLLNLICELSGRCALHNTKVLHDAFWEARNELESRIKPIAGGELYSEKDLRNIISMVCDQFGAGFVGRDEFITKTITEYKTKDNGTTV